MLRVSLSEVKPIVKTLRNSKANTKFANKADVKTMAQKAVPGIAILGNGIYTLTAAKTNKPKYEPCSDFCMEVVG